MKRFGQLFFLASASALCVGYAASQIMYFQNRAPEWARLADSPSVRWLAMLVFVVTLAFVVLQKEEGPEA